MWKKGEKEREVWEEIKVETCFSWSTRNHDGIISYIIFIIEFFTLSYSWKSIGQIETTIIHKFIASNYWCKLNKSNLSILDPMGLVISIWTLICKCTLQFLNLKPWQGLVKSEHILLIQTHILR